MLESQRVLAENFKRYNSYKTLESIKEASPLLKGNKISSTPPINNQPQKGTTILEKKTIVDIKEGVSKTFVSIKNETEGDIAYPDWNLSEKVQMKIMKKKFQKELKDKEADFIFEKNVNNLKTLLDLHSSNTSKKKTTLSQKINDLNLMMTTSNPNKDEIIKNLKKILISTPNKNEETYIHNPLISLTEILNEKISKVNEIDEEIKKQKKYQQTLFFMIKKRKKNLLFFQVKYIQMEEYNKAFDNQKAIIEQKVNDLKSYDILSQITLSEFKKDLLAKTQFNNIIVQRKKDLENVNLTYLKKELSTFVSEFSQHAKMKDNLEKRINTVKELEERNYYLKNLEIHVRTDSLDFIDRISDIFIYNKPEDYILDNYLDLNVPLVKKKVLGSSFELLPNSKGKSKKPPKITKKNSIKSNFGYLFPTTKSKLTSLVSINSPIDSSQMINENKKSNSEIQKESLINRINNFYRKHNNNIPLLANNIINEHTKLAFQEESLNSIIFDLTEQLRKLKNIYTKMVETFNELLKEHENSSNIVEGSDELLKKICFPDDSLLNEKNTVSTLKSEIDQFQIDETSEFLISQKNQHFIFHSFFFFQENFLRLLAILFSISEKNPENKKLPYFIQRLFENLDSNYEDISRNEIYKKLKNISSKAYLSRFSIERIEENPHSSSQIPYSKFKEMQKKFYEFFPEFKKVFGDFLKLMKNDIVLYNFISDRIFIEMLEKLHKKFNSNTTSMSIAREALFMNIFFEEVNSFKKTSYEAFQKDLEKTLGGYIELFEELNNERKKIKGHCELLRRSPLYKKQHDFKKSETLDFLEDDNRDFKKILKKKKKISNKSSLKDKSDNQINLEKEEEMEQEFLTFNRKHTKEIFTSETPINILNKYQDNQNNLKSKEMKSDLKDLIELKNIAKYRFNLDKKIFEMKQEKKKLFADKTSINLENAKYIRTGMSFFPRTTFYNKNQIQQENYPLLTEISDRGGSPDSEMRIFKINRDLLKTYSRSLSPILRIHDRIQLGSSPRGQKK